jgi:hemerythrin
MHLQDCWQLPIKLMKDRNLTLVNQTRGLFEVSDLSTGGQMSLLKWNDTFSIGLDEINEQHKHLIEIINNLHDTLKLDADDQDIATIFLDLRKYALQHFSDEEACMLRDGFPELDKHKKVHRDLETLLEGYERKFDSGDKMIAIDLAEFLMTWLAEHMVKMDGQYGEFLRLRRHATRR